MDDDPNHKKGTRERKKEYKKRQHHARIRSSRNYNRKKKKKNAIEIHFVQSQIDWHLPWSSNKSNRRRIVVKCNCFHCLYWRTFLFLFIHRSGFFPSFFTLANGHWFFGWWAWNQDRHHKIKRRNVEMIHKYGIIRWLPVIQTHGEMNSSFSLSWSVLLSFFFFFFFSSDIPF